MVVYGLKTTSMKKMSQSLAAPLQYYFPWINKLMKNKPEIVYVVDDDEAVRDYQYLSSKDKYNSEYYFNIGFCYLQEGKNQEAILSFGKALDTEYSNMGLLLMLRGIAYNNLKLQGEACSDWQKSVEIGYKEAQKYRNDFCK
jgi:tetratricopeptide (TPR) repeat protein